MIVTASCKRDRENGCQDAVAMTWRHDLGQQALHRFVLGEGNEVPTLAEWVLYIPDGYAHTAAKLRATCRRVLTLGMQYLFYSDVDTYVCVPRLLKAVPHDADYVGFMCSEGHAAGGNGFWLSNKAMRVLANSHCESGVYHDLWAGVMLRQAGIKLVHDERYASFTDMWWNTWIAAHTGVDTGACDPLRMHMAHECCQLSVADDKS